MQKIRNILGSNSEKNADLRKYGRTYGSEFIGPSCEHGSKKQQQQQQQQQQVGFDIKEFRTKRLDS